MRNLPYGFDIYLVNVKTIRQIAQIFVPFSEKLNFKINNDFHFQKVFFISGKFKHNEIAGDLKYLLFQLHMLTSNLTKV